MIRNKIIHFTILGILISTHQVFAQSTSNTNAQDNKNSENTTQKVINDFHTYAGTIKPDIAEEIRKYRIEIVEVNKKKRALYNSLSQEAQSFLVEEQKYKKKLSDVTTASSTSTETNPKESDTQKK